MSHAGGDFPLASCEKAQQPLGVSEVFVCFHAQHNRRRTAPMGNDERLLGGLNTFHVSIRSPDRSQGRRRLL